METPAPPCPVVSKLDAHIANPAAHITPLDLSKPTCIYLQEKCLPSFVSKGEDEEKVDLK